MYWNRDSFTMYVAPTDLTILAQCKIPLEQFLSAHNKNPKIPPLHTVLSYAMLHPGMEHPNIWVRCRRLKELARNRDREYWCYKLPKASGGFRWIRSPKPDLARQQDYIYRNILQWLSIDDHAFAYRKGVGISQCAAPHQGRDVLIHLDIEDFFGSVTEDMVYECLLEQTGYTKSLCRLLAQLCCFRNALPQGTVTSPILSNIVFRACDEALAALADRYKMAYSRYSDDMYFSGSGELPVDAVINEIAQLLKQYGFRLNRDKTQVRRRQHRQAVLGLTVNEQTKAGRNYRRKLMQELYYLRRYGEKSHGAMQCGDYLLYLQKLQGRLSYVLQFEPDNETMQKEHLELTVRIWRQEQRQNNLPF